MNGQLERVLTQLVKLRGMWRHMKDTAVKDKEQMRTAFLDNLVNDFDASLVKMVVLADDALTKDKTGVVEIVPLPLPEGETVNARRCDRWQSMILEPAHGNKTVGMALINKVAHEAMLVSLEPTDARTMARKLLEFADRCAPLPVKPS